MRPVNVEKTPHRVVIPIFKPMSPSTDQRENREFAAELKFTVTPLLAEQIRDWARARLSPDPNASGERHDVYRITSLYFDTERFDVFRRQGSYGRSKFRIRRYDFAKTVFLERKLKTRGLVSKRRSLVPIEELRRLAETDPERGWLGSWYHKRLMVRQLKPVCQISYHRTARVLMTPRGPIRLTLDENIRSVATNDLVYADADNGVLLMPHQVILELKFRAEMPVLFKLLVEEFALHPQPVSKYRLAVTSLGLVAESAADTPVNGRLNTIVCLSS